MLPMPSVPWFVDIYINNRDEVMQKLADRGIATRKMYKSLGNFPNANRLSDSGLFLPSSLDLTDEDIKSICEGVRK